MKAERKSSLIFALTLTSWAGLSLLALMLSLGIVLRLDVAFLESQGMIRNPEIREAIYLRALQIDGVIWLLLGLSVAAVAAVSYLFSRSQFGYFGKLQQALEGYADTGKLPEGGQFGQWSAQIVTFFEVAAMRTRGEPEGRIEPVIEVARKAWPTEPKVHWYDQIQFMIVAAMLSMFFNAACVIFFLQASDHMVQVATRVVRYGQSEAPYFLLAQFEIVSPLMWSILLMASAAFIWTSFRFGRRFSEASYAVIRDLGRFMEGDCEKRLFLRSDDPGRDLIAGMNHSLDRIEGQIRAQRFGHQAEGDDHGSVTPLRLN